MHAQRFNTTTASDVLPAALAHRWRRWPATPKPDAVKQLWKDLTPSTKATLPMLVPMTVWCLRRLKENKPFGETTTRLLVWYSQAVALFALRNMYIHLRKNIGVKRTFTRSFERFSFLGSIIYTASLFRTTHTLFGKTYFLFNLVYTLIYALFLYLSTMYNRGLPHPCQKRERGIVHWPALVGFWSVMAATTHVWTTELKQALLNGDRYQFLSMAGFLVNSIGILRAGYQTAKTSQPAMTPFSGVTALAVAYGFGALTHGASFRASGLARVYVAGYLAMTYCLLFISHLCLKAHRQAIAARQAHRKSAL